MSQLIKKFSSGGQTDPMTIALQNSEHDNWRDAYTEYSGEGGGSWRERRDFRKAWKDEANVRARVGEDTYDQLRAESEQKQFGTQGYNSGSTREKNRFNRRFNRKVRNGSLRPRVTNTPGSTFTKNGTVLYPQLHDYRLPGSVWNTYNRTMNWLGQYQSNLTGVKEGVEEGVKEGDPVEKPTPIDYKAEGLKLLGKDYMNSDNLTKIQQFLVGKNYNLGTYGSESNGVDGIYGQKTHEALSKYLNEVGNAEGWKNINDLFKPADPAGANPGAGGATPPGGANPVSKTPEGGTPGGGTPPGDGANPPTASATQIPPTGDANLVTQTLVAGDANPPATSVVSTVPTANIQNQFDFDNFVKKNNQYKVKEINGKKYLRYDPFGFGDFYVGQDGQIYSSGMFGELGQVLTKKGNKVLFSDGNTFASQGKYLDKFNELLGIMSPYVIKNKQGGKMNKIKYFQQGGQMQQQDPKQQIMQLVQAAMSGDEQATQQINQVFEAAKQGNQQAQQIAQMIQQVVQELKGQATMAKWGSKLGYIKSLKYAKGGKTCPSCQNGGKTLETPSVNKSLKNPIKKVEEKACGGKTKKR